MSQLKNMENKSVQVLYLWNPNFWSFCQIYWAAKKSLCHFIFSTKEQFLLYDSRSNSWTEKPCRFFLKILHWIFLQRKLISVIYQLYTVYVLFIIIFDQQMNRQQNSIHIWCAGMITMWPTIVFTIYKSHLQLYIHFVCRHDNDVINNCVYNLQITFTIVFTFDQAWQRCNQQSYLQFIS